MYHGNHAAKSAGRSGKPVLLVLMLALLICCAVGGTIAWLTTETNAVENTFTPAKVDIDIEETFDGTTKSNVVVRNVENIDAYIRATVIVNYVDKDGKVCPAHSDASLVITNTNDWALGGDGFYYYTKPVTPNETTTALIQSATLLTAEDGCRMQVDIVASAVQAAGVNSENIPAVVAAGWPVTVNTDGTLNVTPGA